jgi:hypothetical protein
LIDGHQAEEAKGIANTINELLAQGNGQGAIDEAVRLRARLKQAIATEPALRKNLDSVQAAIVQLQRAGFTAPPVDGLKLCPFCAEEIQAAAIKCKHCGSTIRKRRSAGYACDPGILRRRVAVHRRVHAHHSIVVASLAAAGAVNRRPSWILAGGLQSGALLVFTFINLHARLNEAREKIAVDLAGWGRQRTH